MDTKLRVNFPPDPNPKPLRFRPPAGTCDTHFHVYGPPHAFPFVEERLYTPPAAPIEHWLLVSLAVGIERGILVQPNVHGFNTDVTVDAIEKSEGRLRGMIRADPNLTQEAAKALHGRGVRGIRFNFARHLGGAMDWVRYERIVGVVASLGWVVDLHIDADLLADNAEMIRSTPAPVLIDHFGRIDGTLGTDQPGYRTLYDLLGEKHVWVKISGADRLMARGASYEQVVPLARALIDRAPDRVVWGTDWPHSNVYQPGRVPNDGDLMNMMLDIAPDEAQRNKVLADNPAKLFGF
ncbi:MAG: amidohydrolase family protein [Proteobacteria bacterium]|nr:amidohydrolase family protein [Pseudomonadota bacterium]